jgi:hypothetical protein
MGSEIHVKCVTERRNFEVLKGIYMNTVQLTCTYSGFSRDKVNPLLFLYICGSVHHQSILLNNQRHAALSSRIYSSLQGYSTCFGCFLHPSSGVQL